MNALFASLHFPTSFSCPCFRRHPVQPVAIAVGTAVPVAPKEPSGRVADMSPVIRAQFFMVKGALAHINTTDSATPQRVAAVVHVIQTVSECPDFIAQYPVFRNATKAKVVELLEQMNGPTWKYGDEPKAQLAQALDKFNRVFDSLPMRADYVPFVRADSPSGASAVSTE